MDPKKKKRTEEVPMRAGFKWLIDVVNANYESRDESEGKGGVGGGRDSGGIGGYGGLHERVQKDVAEEKEREAIEKKQKLERVNKLREEREKAAAAQKAIEGVDEERDELDAGNPFMSLEDTIKINEQRMKLEKEAKRLKQQQQKTSSEGSSLSLSQSKGRLNGSAPSLAAQPFYIDSDDGSTAARRNQAGSSDTQGGPSKTPQPPRGMILLSPLKPLNIEETLQAQERKKAKKKKRPKGNQTAPMPKPEGTSGTGEQPSLPYPLSTKPSTTSVQHKQSSSVLSPKRADDVISPSARSGGKGQSTAFSGDSQHATGENWQLATLDDDQDATLRTLSRPNYGPDIIT